MSRGLWSLPKSLYVILRSNVVVFAAYFNLSVVAEYQVSVPMVEGNFDTCVGPTDKLIKNTQYFQNELMWT